MLYRLQLDDGQTVHLNVHGTVRLDENEDYEVDIAWPRHNGGDVVDDAIKEAWFDIEVAFLAHYLEKHK